MRNQLTNSENGRRVFRLRVMMCEKNHISITLLWWCFFIFLLPFGIDFLVFLLRGASGDDTIWDIILETFSDGSHWNWFFSHVWSCLLDSDYLFLFLASCFQTPSMLFHHHKFLNWVYFFSKSILHQLVSKNGRPRMRGVSSSSGMSMITKSTGKLSFSILTNISSAVPRAGNESSRVEPVVSSTRLDKNWFSSKLGSSSTRTFF